MESPCECVIVPPGSISQGVSLSTVIALIYICKALNRNSFTLVYNELVIADCNDYSVSEGYSGSPCPGGVIWDLVLIGGRSDYLVSGKEF